MLYRFTVISSEVEDFAREIKIDSDATFLDFHKIILDSCQYEDNQVTSFFICDDEWEPTQEVVLEDMGTSLSEDELFVMKDTRLSELIEDEGQRLAYVFDPLSERMFFIELTEIAYRQTLEQPVCSRQRGEAPVQSLGIDEFITKEPAKSADDMNEDFYGSEGFEDEEFDPEGFEISEGNPYE